MICLDELSKMSYYLRKYNTSDQYCGKNPDLEKIVRDINDYYKYLNIGPQHLRGHYLVSIEYLGRIQ